MTGTEFERALGFLKGLADETRLRLLGILAGGERSVEELAALVGVKAPTVSHHLVILKNLGLVKMEAQGNTHLYRFDAEALRRLGREFVTPDAVASLSPPVAEGAWEQKVLRDFMEGDQIRQWPVRLKKRLVILEWLAGRFEAGRRYREKEVNEILKAHHPDFATLRRELVDFHFMTRENGVYWLLDAAARRTGDQPMRGAEPAAGDPTLP